MGRLLGGDGAPCRAPQAGSWAAARRLTDRAGSAVVVTALAGTNLTQHVLGWPWRVRPIEAGALLALARLQGLGWAELGLSRQRVPSGCRWGLGAVASVAAVYCAGVLVPVTRPAFRDSRYDLPLREVLFPAFVVIPLGTVMSEEIAFRSVLWGVLSRHSRQAQVLVTTSALFGVWHVLPARRIAGTNQAVSGAAGGRGTAVVVPATVALTTLGGVVFGELRRRSGSVLAPIAAHWATNALGVLFGVVSRHLGG
ncbi:MAG TPA: CPBP family intramembrane glutamic endopeptidase [Blastococcus sp.]